VVGGTPGTAGPPPSPTECPVALASSAAPARDTRRNQGLDEALRPGTMTGTVRGGRETRQPSCRIVRQGGRRRDWVVRRVGPGVLPTCIEASGGPAQRRGSRSASVAPAHFQVLETRDTLLGPYPVRWDSWTMVSQNELGFLVGSGLAECQAARVHLTELADEIRVGIEVGSKGEPGPRARP